MDQTLPPRSRHSFSPVSRNAVSRSIVSRSIHAADSFADAANDYMAGSPRNPLMNEQWRTDDHAARDHHHFPRERERVREKPDRRQQSPPSFQRRGRGRERGHPGRGRGGSNANHQLLGRHSGSRGRGDKKSRGGRPPGHLSSSHQRPFHPEDQDPGFAFDEAVRSRPPPEWDDRPLPPSPNPPFKRRRTRSPSPYPRHHPSFKQKRGRGKDFSPRGKKHRGRDFSPKGPYRGKHRPPSHRPDASTSEYFYDQRRGRSGSPFSREGQRDLSPANYYHDSRYDHPFEEQDQREFASPSSPRHSIYSRASRESPRPPSLREDPTMQSSRRNQSIVDERSPSPLRPIPTFDTDNSFHPDDANPRPRESFPMRGMRQSSGRGSHRTSRPHVDTRQSFGGSPQYATPDGSRHGSPQSGSPYSSGRGSWGAQPPPSYRGQQEQLHGYSPPYRQNSYSSSHGTSQAEYYQSQQGQYASTPNHSQGGYPVPPYRGGHSAYRGAPYNQSQNRRFSGANAQTYNTPPQQRNQNARFSNLQWTASSGRGRGSPQLQSGPPRPMAPMQQSPQLADQRMSPDLAEDDNPFRPSKALRVEDQNSKPDAENGDTKTMPPPQARQPSASAQPKEKEKESGAGKFSFAFKSKAAPPPTPKPVPDLAQRMREPPRPVEDTKSRKSSVPPPREKHDYRQDHRDDRRDPRRGDRRVDHRAERKRDRRDERRMEAKHDRRHNRHDRRERSPPPKKPKKVLKRMKPRPTLTEEFAESDSVYYRKPGNESVIGAGTYGKVFKAVHVYTENKVALKKIRMEGEKDGFPITAVREIRLLQHLRHENVVRLQEVMVEKNECFMVFEYLSHDLTGLINHPTFALTAGHKKHLAKQMFEGLNYLHHRGVLHRDIKAANILISNQGLLKYADFGLARFFSKSRQLDYTNRVITIWYRPPELLLGETRYGPAVDVWSAACVYVEMFTKKAVFPGEGGEISQLDKLYNSLGTPTRTDWPGIVDMPWFELLRPREKKGRTFEDTYKEFLSPAALDLVAQMFQYDPAKRPTAEEVLAHPYFTTEEPLPQQATELSSIEGDWHEFESKAHRKEKNKEARRAEYQREKEKRRISGGALPSTDRDSKRAKLDEGSTSQPRSLGTEN